MYWFYTISDISLSLRGPEIPLTCGYVSVARGMDHDWSSGIDPTMSKNPVYGPVGDVLVSFPRRTPERLSDGRTELFDGTGMGMLEAETRMAERLTGLRHWSWTGIRIAAHHKLLTRN